VLTEGGGAFMATNVQQSLGRSPIRTANAVSQETNIHPGFLALGLVCLYASVVFSAMIQGIADSDAMNSALTTPEAAALAISVLLVGIGAYVTGRGLWYPSQALPKDESVLQGRTRRAASVNSRLSEAGSSGMVAGAALILLRVFVLASFFVYTVSSEPITPWTPPIIQQTLEISIIACFVGGGIALFLGSVLARPASK
jgi:hypothetical protein